MSFLMVDLLPKKDDDNFRVVAHNHDIKKDHVLNIHTDDKFEFIISCFIKNVTYCSKDKELPLNLPNGFMIIKDPSNVIITNKKGNKRQVVHFYLNRSILKESFQKLIDDIDSVAFFYRKSSYNPMEKFV